MKNMIKKELLYHIQSLQFVVLIGITTILFTTNGIIFIKKYYEQMDTYNRGVTASSQNPSTVMTSLYKKPEPLTFVVDGGNKYQPPGYTLRPRGKLTAMPSGPRNYKLPNVPELDWTFIIKVIFSLFVLLLGYRTISGEKENGTLRMILSNSVGRSQVLIVKYVSILLTLSIPLIIGCMISFIITGFYIPQILTLNYFLRIVIIWLLIFIFLSSLAFLSLLFSSLIHRSSVVLLMLLSFWILFTVIIPNGSGILAEKLAQLPSEYQTAKELGPMIQQEIWAEIDKIRARVNQGEIQSEEAMKRETDRAFVEGQKKLVNLYRNYDNVMDHRARLARRLSRISPIALFQFSSESIANTGTIRETHFLRDAQAYSQIYDEYILEKVGRLVGSSGWGFGTYFEMNGQMVSISSPEPEEYHGDKSDFPRFIENRPSITLNLRNAFLDTAGLLLWNLILAALAFMAFTRCDVR